jgi:hypothetical protein
MKKRIQCVGDQLYPKQWAAMELLEPGWLMLKHSCISSRTRTSLLKRGWIEVLDYPNYMRVRLTEKGINFRNRIYTHLARVKAWKQGEKTQWRHFKERYPPDGY